MVEDLQGLLDRIQTDGLQKAEAERTTILDGAKEKAETLLSEAKREAAALLKRAHEDAAASQAKANEAIRQAARDVLIELKQELLERLKNAVKSCAGDAMTPELMAQLISEMAKSYAKPGASVQAMIPARDWDAAQERLKALLPSDLKARTVLGMGRDFSAGLKIGFSDSDVFLDFSDDALADILCGFVGPKLAAILKA